MDSHNSIEYHTHWIPIPDVRVGCEDTAGSDSFMGTLPRF